MTVQTFVPGQVEIKMTEAARKQAQRELERAAAGGIRLDLDESGCSGYMYELEFVDQPVAGLVKDLKTRGLLDETLVIFSGEFGRTPFVQGTNGRDHNPYGFSLWLAGGGLKTGFIYGQTDEYGYRVVENAHTVRDLHATVLTLLGLDYQNLTYRFGGRDFRLADVDGHPIRGIFA